MSQHRQLAAIMFTDIQGYTAMMQQDEDRAVKIRERHREVFNRITSKYNGKILQYYGDGTLSVFDSAIDAVQCGIDIQLEYLNEPAIPVRIGIHAGDIIFSEEEIIGDGVNVTSRIESLAIPGSVFVSEKVYDEIKNQLIFQTQCLGYFELKNVEKPMLVYTMSNPGLRIPEKGQIQGKAQIPAPVKISIGKTQDFKKIISIGVVFLGMLFFVNFFYPFIPTIINKIQTEKKSEFAGDEIQDKSIAVLPFENMSADENNQYFADGQMEAILNHLTRIADLRVISRTTMMGYRGTTRSVREIGKELGVSYVLEGSVQKSGNVVRITAQLIESISDNHLWSENYDREITDIFNIQTEIAKNVAQKLNATLTLQEQMEIESVPTTNPTAYDFYLKGMDYYSKSERIDDFEFAIQMFNRAVEIDPNFTLAWIGLASASRHIYWFQFDRSDEHKVKIKKYLDKAIAIEPDLWEVQLEIGLYYYQCLLNYTEAIQILEKLKSDYPKNDQLYLWAGAIYRRMGQYEKAIEYMDNAILLNPLDWNYWYNAGETLIILERYQQAEEYFNNVIDLNPSGIEGYVIMADLYLMTGEIEKVRILINNQQIKDPAMYLMGSQAELLDRNYQEAIKILNSSPEKVVTNNLSYKPISMQIGLIYHMLSNSKLANVHFQEAREDLEGKLSELPYDSRLYSSLGIVYGGLGLKEKAMAAGNEALDIMNISIDAWMGFYREWDMARILLLVGENDKAIAKLEWLLPQNGDLSIELLKRDPFWDPLRNIDSFNTLIEHPK